MKVCDAFMGIAAELGGFRNACPNIYHLIQAPNIWFRQVSKSNYVPHIVSGWMVETKLREKRRARQT